MSEALEIAQSMYDYLTSKPSLEYIYFSMFEDMMTLDEKGKYPFCNIEIDTIKYTNADNQDLTNMERHLYPVRLLMSNRNEAQKFIKLGDEGTSFKSIFDIWEEIYAEIQLDRSFGNNEISSKPYRPVFICGIQQRPDGKFWLGRAMTIFEVYKDRFLK